MPLQKYYARYIKEPNKAPPRLMHIDMNSFFATCEVFKNPLLKGLPVAVVPHLQGNPAILASSYPAKFKGVKTGMRYRDAKKLCPNLQIFLADASFYRKISQKIMSVFRDFTPKVIPKSVDEALLDFTNVNTGKKNMEQIAFAIKQALKKRVGECFTCSIGVANSPFLAKIASNVYKPDGYYYLNPNNLLSFYKSLKLSDLYGVGKKTEEKLNDLGIYTPIDFYNASLQFLQAHFKTNGYYWYVRLRGYSIDVLQTPKKSVGHSYHLKMFSNDYSYLTGIILKLSQKVGYRLRANSLSAKTFYVYLKFVDKTSWAHRQTFTTYTNLDFEIYKNFLQVFNKNPYKSKKVKILLISTSSLSLNNYHKQKSLFENNEKRLKFYTNLDKINNKFGAFTLMPAKLLNYKDIAPDRISFGK